jgi:hypothetical protein
MQLSLTCFSVTKFSEVVSSTQYVYKWGSYKIISYGQYYPYPTIINHTRIIGPSE